MAVNIQPAEFDRFYSQAKEGYRTCINNPNNAFLQAEASLPLREIEGREGQVKIVFSAGSTSLDQVEVHLGLYANGKWMGDYVAILDATGQVIDDRLAFH